MLESKSIRTGTKVNPPASFGPEDQPKPSFNTYIADSVIDDDKVANVRIETPSFSTELWMTIESMTAIRDALNAALVQLDD